MTFLVAKFSESYNQQLGLNNTMKRIRHEDIIPSSDKQIRQRAIVADWLRTKGALLGALDVIPIYEEEKYLTLGLGHNSTLSGRIYETPVGPWAAIDYFEVGRHLRGHGIGERLLKAFVVESRNIGATVLWSNGVSNSALALRRKVFGDDLLEFYDCQSSEYGFLPISVGQAIQINDRIDALDAVDDNRPNPQGHIGVCVNLERLNTAGWEGPRILEYIE